MTQTTTDAGRLARGALDEQPPVPDELVPYKGPCTNGMPDVFHFHGRPSKKSKSAVTLAVLWHLCNRWSWAQPARWESAGTIAREIGASERGVELALAELREDGLISVVHQRWGARTKAIPVIWCLWLIPGGSWSAHRFQAPKPKPDPRVNLKVVRPPKSRRAGAAHCAPTGAADCAAAPADYCTEVDSPSPDGAMGCATVAQSAAPPSYMDCSKSDSETKPSPLLACESGSESGTATTPELPPSVARFKNIVALASSPAGDRCERPGDASSSAGPARRSSVRTPAETAAERLFTNRIARLLYAVDRPDGPRDLDALAGDMAFELGEPDSISFHRSVLDALLAGADRRLIAATFQEAIRWRENPQIVKKGYLRFGPAAPRKYFGQTVWPIVEAMKNAAPGNGSNRPRVAAPNDDRRATVSPGA